MSLSRHSKHTLVGGIKNDVTRAGNALRRRLLPFSRTINEFLQHAEWIECPATRLNGADRQGGEVWLFIVGSSRRTAASDSMFYHSTFC